MILRRIVLTSGARSNPRTLPNAAGSILVEPSARGPGPLQRRQVLGAAAPVIAATRLRKGSTNSARGAARLVTDTSGGVPAECGQESAEYLMN